MTEDEAKKKVCPATFGIPDERDEYGSGIRQGGPWKCIGSACMAWRHKGQIGIGPRGERRDRDLDGMTKWVSDGYCGLAGAPQ